MEKNPGEVAEELESTVRAKISSNLARGEKIMSFPLLAGLKTSFVQPNSV